MYPESVVIANGRAVQAVNLRIRKSIAALEHLWPDRLNKVFIKIFLEKALNIAIKQNDKIKSFGCEADKS